MHSLLILKLQVFLKTKVKKEKLVKFSQKENIVINFWKITPFSNGRSVVLRRKSPLPCRLTKEKLIWRYWQPNLLSFRFVALALISLDFIYLFIFMFYRSNLTLPTLKPSWTFSLMINQNRSYACQREPWSDLRAI